ncbi:unnamed protein product, partial [Schistosoma margrebowiei]|uniref:Transmembrane protein 218 N-terminal domain-containing protein n=1 Tax=Schistosoma margrebowiei TaxID=48269 RepID=A0AA84ZT89_9TREM
MATILGVGPGVFILCMLWAATIIICLVISYRETRSNFSCNFISDNLRDLTCYSKGFK